MMHHSEHIFQSISYYSKFSGIMCISAKRVSEGKSTFGIIFLLASIVIFLSNSILISSVFWDFREGGGSSCTVAVMGVYGTMLSSYYIVRGEKIFQNFQDLMDVQDLFSSTPEDLPLYEKVIGVQIKRVNRFIRNYFLFNFFLLPINAMQAVLSHISQYLAQYLKKDNPLLYPVYYFDVTKNDAVFWPTIAFESLLLHLIIVLHTINDLYILNVTISLILSFKYLRLKLETIINSCLESSTDDTPNLQLNQSQNPRIVITDENLHNETNLKTAEGKIKLWLKYHDHLLRLSRDFTELFTPVMVSFFIFVFTNGSLGIFYITKGQADIFSVSEKVMILVYFVGSVNVFMMICMAGTQLQLESQMVSRDACHGPWYHHSRKVKTALLIISSVSRRPVRLTPKMSNTAELSLHTFVWVLNSMASFYIAFTRIQEIYNQKNLKE